MPGKPCIALNVMFLPGLSSCRVIYILVSAQSSEPPRTAHKNSCQRSSYWCETKLKWASHAPQHASYKQNSFYMKTRKMYQLWRQLQCLKFELTCKFPDCCEQHKSSSRSWSWWCGRGWESGCPGSAGCWCCWSRRVVCQRRTSQHWEWVHQTPDHEHGDVTDCPHSAVFSF